MIKSQVGDNAIPMLLTSPQAATKDQFLIKQQNLLLERVADFVVLFK